MTWIYLFQVKYSDPNKIVVIEVSTTFRECHGILPGGLINFYNKSSLLILTNVVSLFTNLFKVTMNK